MYRKSVPVSMGSSRFVTAEAASTIITSASFPAHEFLEPHVHERATLAVILEGDFELSFRSAAMRRRRYECTRGCVFSEPAGETHSNLISGRGARALVLQPDPSLGGLPAATERMLDRVNHVVSPWLLQLAMRLACELSFRDGTSMLAREGLVLEMLAAATRSTGPGQYRDAPTWLARVEQYLLDNSPRVATMADLSAVAGVSASEVATVYRREHGLSPASHQRLIRLEWVEDQLVGTDRPIAAIAHDAGFSDQAHMARTFKKHHGVAPSTYRRRHLH